MCNFLQIPLKNRQIFVKDLACTKQINEVNNKNQTTRSNITRNVFKNIIQNLFYMSQANQKTLITKHKP